MSEKFSPETSRGHEEPVWKAAAAFVPPQWIRSIFPYGKGNVNDTYLVTLSRAARAESSGSSSGEIAGNRFILQRLSPAVFQQPDLVMANLGVVTEHVAGRLKDLPLPPGRRFELPRIVRTLKGQDCLRDDQGFCWRALSFIDGAETFDHINDEGHAREVGWALGLFHRLLSDLPPERLADTLPGFHETPRYLRQYEVALAGDGFRQSPEVAFCMRFVEERRRWAGVLEEAKSRGELVVRPIHGDPKVNNFLLERKTGRAVALVDLDTVKPGLTHYDLGDCLRSGCNPMGEETPDWEKVSFEPELARALLSGYLIYARDFLTDQDFLYFYAAVRLMAFELGLRFFTDYLAGNVYFKVAWREHNLLRALVQFKLTLSIEAQAEVLQSIIREMRQGAAWR
jgi:Ser/Thr protein kinase RdoA (MazF antagonist)